MSSSSFRQRAMSLPFIGWGAALTIMIVMFGLWPYQHWFFETKYSLFGGWWRFVMENDEWIFCPAVPVVSVWFAWQLRGELKAIPLRPHWLGLVLMVLAFFCYWVGHRADTAYPGFIAAQLMVAGLIIWLCGLEWMRVLFFPWIFLVFMWPVFPLEDQLALPLRVITAGWASKVLTVIGLANSHEGSKILSLADSTRGLAAGQLFQLDVSDPCSGIRSLYALMMLSALYGYLLLRGLWPRLALFLCAIPLAVLGNLVRMVLLALGCVWFGAEFAIGKMVEGQEEISLYHELAGYAVFAVALAGMFAISSMLEGKHWKRRKKKPTSSANFAADAATESARLLPAFLQRAGISLAMGAVTLILCSAIKSQPALSPPGVNMTLPTSIGSMQGQEIPMTKRESDNLAADITLSRSVYLGDGGHQLAATVVLSGQTRRGLHRPDVCLPGQGWIIGDRQTLPIKLSDGREFTAMLLRVFRDYKDEQTGQVMRQRGLNIFWYQGFGVATSNYYHHVLITYIDSIFKSLNHRWALVSFFSQLPSPGPGSGMADGLAEARGLLELQEFVQTVGPKIIKADP